MTVNRRISTLLVIALAVVLNVSGMGPFCFCQDCWDDRTPIACSHVDRTHHEADHHDEAADESEHSCCCNCRSLPASYPAVTNILEPKMAEAPTTPQSFPGSLVAGIARRLPSWLERDFKTAGASLIVYKCVLIA